MQKLQDMTRWRRHRGPHLECRKDGSIRFGRVRWDTGLKKVTLFPTLGAPNRDAFEVILLVKTDTRGRRSPMGFTIKKARDALERYNDGAPLSLLNFLRLLEEHMGEDIWGEKRYAIFALVNAEETEESLTVDFSEYAGME